MAVFRGNCELRDPLRDRRRMGLVDSKDNGGGAPNAPKDLKTCFNERHSYRMSLLELTRDRRTRKIEKGDETQTQRKRRRRRNANADADATQIGTTQRHGNLDLCSEGEKSLIIKR
jgi:hypothetical protein